MLDGGSGSGSGSGSGAWSSRRRWRRRGVAGGDHDDAVSGDLALDADGGDGLVDLRALGGGELAEIRGHPGDQPPDPGDFLLVGQGLSLGPVVNACGG